MRSRTRSARTSPSARDATRRIPTVDAGCSRTSLRTSCRIERQALGYDDKPSPTLRRKTTTATAFQVPSRRRHRNPRIPNSIAVPEPKGELLGEIQGISLVADRDYMFAQLERLVGLSKGTDAPGDFYAALEADIAADKRRAENDPNNVDVGTPEPNEAIQAKTCASSLLSIA